MVGANTIARTSRRGSVRAVRSVGVSRRSLAFVWRLSRKKSFFLFETTRWRREREETNGRIRLSSFAVDYYKCTTNASRRSSSERQKKGYAGAPAHARAQNATHAANLVLTKT